MVALSLGGGRRRWAPCRGTAGTGIRRPAGCRHFHVHVHFPRRQQQVRAFSPLRLPPLFYLLLTYMLVLPVLLLAVLAFLVCFGWFTFVYFVSACVLRERNSGSSPDDECSENERDAGASSSEHHCRKEQSGQELLLVSSEKEQQLRQGTSSVDRSVEEETFVGTASCGTANPVHLQSVGEEDPTAYCKSDEILELIDKHETSRKVVVICSDNSADQNDVKYDYGEDLLLLPDDNSDDDELKGAEDFFDASKLREDHHFVEEKEKHVLCVSEETKDDFNSVRETSVSSQFDSGTENKYAAPSASDDASFDHTGSDEEEVHEREVTTEDNMAADASGTASVSSGDFCENYRSIREEIGVPGTTENNIHEVASGEISSVIGRTEDDEDENSCTSEVGSRRLPMMRRSQPPQWWNLCGVLDVLTGGKD